MGNGEATGTQRGDVVEMDFQTIKNTLVSTELLVIDLRAKANSEDASENARVAFRSLIDTRVEAFVRLINDFSTKECLEVCSAMTAARGQA